MVDQYISTLIFFLIASVTGVCAIATVVSHNIVRSATWLLFTLAGTSGIFFALGADIVGAIQLLVYVGGTMVLVVFGVMLTAQGPFVNMKTSGGEWAISITAGILLFAILCGGMYSYLTNTPQGAGPANRSLAVKHGPKHSSNEDPKDSHHTTTLAQALVGAPFGPAYDERELPPSPNVKTPKKVAADEPPVVTKGKSKNKKKDDTLPAATPPEFFPLGTHYLLPFEIVSVHLLVVLISAAYLARAKRLAPAAVASGEKA